MESRLDQKGVIINSNDTFKMYQIIIHSESGELPFCFGLDHINTNYSMVYLCVEYDMNVVGILGGKH